MELRSAELGRELARGLAPVYLVAGDELLLVQEACDAIVTAARGAGFTERVVLHADNSGFNWNDVLQESASLSLFAERRIIDVRVPAAAFGRDGSEVLVAVEYLVFVDAWKAAGNTEPPSFFGEPFVTMIDDPATEEDEAHGLAGHHELHIWVPRDNPNGMFAEFNPAVSCAHGAVTPMD